MVRQRRNGDEERFRDRGTKGYPAGHRGPASSGYCRGDLLGAADRQPGTGAARGAGRSDRAGRLVDRPRPPERDRVALNLVPFAGIAFLWFVGVIRSRLGAQEDQFLATVMLGSGLLFVACLFGAAALAGGLSDAVAAGHVQLPDSETYYFGRHTSNALLNVFAIKMAAVFMFSTCTIGLRTAIFPRWVAFVGYACALVLLVVITNWAWIALLFPLWVLLVSTVILTAEFGRRRGATDPAAQAADQDDLKPATGPRRGAKSCKKMDDRSFASSSSLAAARRSRKQDPRRKESSA